MQLAKRYFSNTDFYTYFRDGNIAHPYANTFTILHGSENYVWDDGVSENRSIMLDTYGRVYFFRHASFLYIVHTAREDVRFYFRA